MSPRELAVLLTLLAEARELTNVELFSVAGVTLDGAPRRKLNGMGLVTSEKVGRALVHELTDRGVQWCTDELTRPRPQQAGSHYCGALYAMLAGLHRHLDSTGQLLTDVFQPDVAGQITRKYTELSEGKERQVRLADLRAQLPHVPPEDFSATLRRLARRDGVHVRAEADRKMLSSEDHAAAVELGGTARHLLTIEAAR
ncbi:hypothetical protein [Nocardia caishijiensis]|uniref:Golgi phosphoprotein 3 GPP34 n=1 Tax=Nocardia caishijiensis TaxID=184756 RepID=A0ABQ6YU95_9NOCA|nr:hypothetical protein [Nocardia caishijiensis]KAF0849001.1 hypothetical protein FNL39_101436 [Nocardia caishijiensis]